MSDREWIDRVRSSRPEDLSSGDVGRLRDEARRSPELRKALADEIRLDQALHAAAGRSPLSTSKIVAHVTAAAAAGSAGAAGGSLVGALAGWFSVLALTIIVAALGVLIVPEPGSNFTDIKRGALSSEKSTILESPSAAAHGGAAHGAAPAHSFVERIDPIEDPRFADDGSSPSDKAPVSHEPARGQSKSPGKVAAPKPAVSKTEHATAESGPMPRSESPAGKGSVSQK